MRTVLLSVALVTSLFGFAGCQGSGNPNSPAMQAMDNPPNACGPGGSSDSEDCDRGR